MDNMTSVSAKPSVPAWQHALVAAAAVISASALGGLATAPNIPGWYAGLIKPSFSPPNWIFGPVWSLLYAMMGYAVYRVMRLPEATPGRLAALVVFFGQLVLNASWSWAFFASQSPALGLVVIIPLLAMIILTIILFRPLDRAAALLLVPYAAWVSFATLLNAAIWHLNR